MIKSCAYDQHVVMAQLSGKRRPLACWLAARPLQLSLPLVFPALRLTNRCPLMCRLGSRHAFDRFDLQRQLSYHYAPDQRQRLHSLEHRLGRQCQRDRRQRYYQLTCHLGRQC